MSTCIHDLPNAAVVAAAFPPAVLTDTASGSAVDLAAADGPCFAVQVVGAVAGDTTLAGALEESANGSSWSTVADGVFVTASAPGVQTIRFTRSARYVRWTGTPDGSDPSVAAAVLIVQEKKLF